jgi:hypothetical protein
VRLLDGRLRATAALSLALVVVVLAFSGPYVAAPAGIALLALGFVRARAGGAAGTCRRAPVTVTALRRAPTPGR